MPGLEGNHEQVLDAVLSEIKTIGATSKENYTALRTNVEALKKEVDAQAKNTDVLLKEKVDKLLTDITTRQDEMDKAQTKRVDSIEAALKRPGMSAQNIDGKTSTEEALEFFKAVSSISQKGAKWQDIKRLEKEGVPSEQYQGYKGQLIEYLRRDEKTFLPGELKDLSVGVDPNGGYTVTPQISSRIIQKIYESDPIRQLASVETISTDALEIMNDFSQAGAGWEGETETGAKTDTPTIGRLRIPVHILYAKPRATQQLLEDSGLNIENWLADHVARRFMRIEAAAFVTGDGVNKPRGFLTHTSGTTYTSGQIEQTNMGAAAALTADGLISVKFSLIEYYLNRASWLMNRSTVAAAMKLKDGEGRYIWSPGLTEREPSMLLGLPLRMSTTMPAVAANALSVAIADWAEAYQIVDRLGISVQRDPYTVKPFVEFYTRKRVGGSVVNFEAIKIGKVAA